MVAQPANSPRTRRRGPQSRPHSGAFRESVAHGIHAGAVLWCLAVDALTRVMLYVMLTASAHEFELCGGKGAARTHDAAGGNGAVGRSTCGAYSDDRLSRIAASLHMQRSARNLRSMSLPRRARRINPDTHGFSAGLAESFGAK